MNWISILNESHVMASAVLTWLMQSLVFGTLLAGITWGVFRWQGRRIPPAGETLLWSMVLVKFLLPMGLACSISLPEAYKSSPFSFAEQEGSFTSETNPKDSGLALTPNHWAQINSHVNQGQVNPHVKPEEIQPEKQMVQEGGYWKKLAVMAYLAFVMALVVRRVWCHQILFLKCCSLPLAAQTTQKIARHVCRQLNVQRIPRVRISEETRTSFVMGFFSPMLVLSRSQLVRPDELETVILHEVAHLRRGDMIVRYLQWIAGSLFFFWPIVAWVNRRIDLAREYACDEWALRRGKLAAGEYARCLLKAIQPMRAGHLAFPSTSLATNQKSIERRIDMILEYPGRSSKGTGRSLLTVMVLLIWVGFALTGAMMAAPNDSKPSQEWLATEEAVKEHAIQVYNLVAERQDADMNGDGSLTYVEKDAFLIALAMQNPKDFMEEFPYADRNQSGMLDCLEVYGVIRGITLIAYADRRPNAREAVILDFEFYHKALEAQNWILDHVTSKPSAEELDNAWSIVKRIQGPPQQDHRCKLDHGGPEPPEKSKKGSYYNSPRFQELENNIKAIKAKLRIERDAIKAGKLQMMLEKLEEILSRLENS